MQYHKMENDAESARELANSLCAELGTEFVPNFAIALHWPASVLRARAERDVKKFFAMFGDIIDRRTLTSDDEPDDLVRISASKRTKMLNECIVWGRYDDKVIDKSLIENLPSLWEYLIGGSSELSFGKEVAFEGLVNACEKQAGSLVFSCFPSYVDDDDD